MESTLQKDKPIVNDEQSLVAENHLDNLLLLAGAGTGKTLTLACRVANLLAENAAAPEEILCLTFTNRACKEMRERIERMAGTAAKAVVIRTIHSFCAWLLRKTPGTFTDLQPDFAVCDPEDALELIREVVFEVTGRSLADSAAKILQNFIAMVKDCQLSQSEQSCDQAAAFLFVHHRTELERICIDDSRRFDRKFFSFLARYGGSLTRMYQLKLLSNHLLDFSDLLLRADRLLSDPRIAAVWLEQFRYVHIDEAQDLSLAEYSLLTRLCGNARVLLCGDFNQTIYQWRGSDPDTLLTRFEAEFHPQKVEFTVNYRSSAGLLAVSNYFLKAAFGKKILMDSLPEWGDAVCIHAFDTMAEEADWIYQELSALNLSDYSRAAIIVRNNRTCADLCDLLRASRAADSSETPVPFMLADELRLFKKAEIKDLLACISLIANPHDGEALTRVVKRYAVGVGAATIEGILSCYREGLGVALCDFIDPRTRFCGDYFEPLLAALADGRVIVYDVESTGTDVWNDEIIQLAAVRLAPDGTIAARFERFIHPTKPVGSSEKVHGFSDIFLAENGEAAQTALTALLDFIGDCVIVGHNVAFDMEITRQNLRRGGEGQPFEPVWYDTLDLSRRFLKTLENHKLDTVAAALGTQRRPSHDAMDDILATADVLLELNRQYLTPKTENRRACYAKYLPRFSEFSQTVHTLREKTRMLDAPAVVKLLLSTFGLEKAAADSPEKTAHLALFSDFTREFTDRTDPLGKQLSDLLELTALSAGELDRMSPHTNKVAVITAHQSKGCEFDYVFLPVLQDGVFPAAQSIRTGDLLEEKRVFYVSITRAKKKLFLSWAGYGLNHYPAKPSRFLEYLWELKAGETLK